MVGNVSGSLRSWVILVAIGGFGACRSDVPGSTDVEASSGAMVELPTCEPVRAPAAEVWCGCLCLDPAWSCSQEIGLAADGKAYGLEDEAGFLEIPSHTWSWEGTPYPSGRHRLWYAFKPASSPTPDTPLLVAFNGGPGTSSQILFGGNTHSLNADPRNLEAVSTTEAPWTAFAHVLYIDAPRIGFSYALPPEDPVWSAEHDAAMFLLAILGFVERHPALATAEVVPIGESYGGFRAVMMQALVQGPDERAMLGYHNDLLDLALERADANRRPCEEGSTPVNGSKAPFISRVATIQGAVLGPLPNEQSAEPPRECIDGGDGYDCRRRAGSVDEGFCTIFNRVRDPVTLSELTGVDVTTIAWLGGEAHDGAVPSLLDRCESSEAGLVNVLGDLPDSQTYFVGALASGRLADRYVGSWSEGYFLGITEPFLVLLRTGDAFLTNARYDLVVDARDLEVLLGHPDVLDVRFDMEPRPGVDRPGWVTIALWAGDGDDDSMSKTLRVPTYEAGHAVSLDEPIALSRDLEAWLASD